MPRLRRLSNPALRPWPHRPARLRRALPALLAVLGAMPAPACGEHGEPLFREAGEEAGLAIPLTCGDPGPDGTILDVNGNGVALVDLDADGDLDLVLVEGSTRHALVAGGAVRHHVLLNRGARDGLPRFERVEAHGLEQLGWPTGIACGDVDGDGLPDLVVGGLGEDALFLNRGPREAGGAMSFEKHVLAGRTSPRDWTTSVALADADGDGFLDVFLARYLDIDPADPPVGQVGGTACRFRGHPVMCGPHGMPPQPDVLLRGIGRAPWLADASEASGLRASPPAYSLGALFTDLDGDGRPDLYIANDSVPNRLLRNLGDGRFEDVSALSGAATDLAGRAQAGMGVDAGDVDRDGDLDLVVTNFSGESNALYRNDGTMLFRDVSAGAGIAEDSRTRLGWGAQLADFDADGWIDLHVANGHVFPQADLPGMDSSYAQPQQLFLGGPGGRLREVPFPDAAPLLGRGSARGDLDGDGDLDLVVLTLHGAPRLYVNTTDAPSRQMLVTLDGAGRPAFGAVLRAETDSGPRVAVCLGGSGFQSASDPRLHLAGARRVVSARLVWPGGEVETLDPDALVFGHRHVVRRGEGVVASVPLGTAGEP